MMLKWIPFIAVLVAAPRPTEACKKRHQTPFELFDAASTVAFVTIRKTPSMAVDRIKAGDVELAVRRVVKGTRTQVIIAKESETDCRASYQLGREALVFLRPDGLTVGAHDGHLRDVQAWEPVIDAWVQAAGAKAKAAVLVDAIASGKQAVSDEAVDFLLDQPTLLDEISAAQTKRIATALAKQPKGPMPVMLLVRLRDSSAPSRANVPAWAKPARGMLAVKGLPDDIAKLAAIIAAATRADDPRAAVAMERCERLHRKHLASFERYFGGLGDWKALAETCRTGT